MSKASEDLLESFLSLAPEERAQFLVDAQARFLDVEPDVLAAQEEEALRRAEAYRNGEIEAVSHDQVMQALRG